MNKILRNKYNLAVLIAVVTFLVYLPSLQNDFINSWDDNRYISENSFIRSLDSQLLESAFAGFYSANWHPLTWLSHAVDYALWGLNPFGHHLTNNILHALNALLVVFLVLRLMEVFKQTAGHNGQSQLHLDDRAIMITAAVSGLLFGLHPIHVESVAWISERKDLLCAFFFLLTIITYTHYVSDINARASLTLAARFFNKKYLLAIGFFTLSLLSKSMAVTLPFVLLILDWYLFGRVQSFRNLRTALIEKLPFFALSLISSLLTVLAQEAAGAVNSAGGIPVALRVLMIPPKALVAYLTKMMVPIDLVPFYPYPKNISLFSPEYIIPIVVVMAITAACIAVVRKQRLWMSVWSYYVITLIPVLGIIQVGDQSMADRYTYLPSLGPFLLIGLTASKAYEKVSAFNRWRVTLKIASSLIALGMLAALSYATVQQLGIWKNDITFWNYVIEEEPSVGIAHFNLGVVYMANGFNDMARKEFESALAINRNDYWSRRFLESITSK